ncbi:MAG TPA: type II secretion system F family protein [Candidatus Nanoarchaeia archaeon]|nr:type II secretion system F family protein [Candidatus Nanoarchaeia archaeon]
MLKKHAERHGEAHKHTTHHEPKTEPKHELKPETKPQDANQAKPALKAEPKKFSFQKAKKDGQQKKHERKLRFKFYLEIAGLETDLSGLFRIIFYGVIFLNILISFYLLYFFSFSYGISWNTITWSLLSLWTLFFALFLLIAWVMFYVFVDVKIYRRKTDIEEVFPDFLQLTASNINAGMPIDRALWFAVRPRFGVLAKEIEVVAKETMSGSDLKLALEKFTLRYDSVILKRSISMINEGIDAGGRIGDLLNRIAIDIQDQKAMSKEMSANVTTYVIFITFATIVAAPFLFALSGILINVVGSISTAFDSTTSAVVSANLPLSFSGAGVSKSDFRTFAVFSLTLTSFFSAIMVAIIKKGNAKSGIKYIPIFIAVSLFLYFLASTLGTFVFGAFFSI